MAKFKMLLLYAQCYLYHISEILINIYTLPAYCKPFSISSFPHTSVLFSCNFSRDFGRHRVCQFLKVTSLTEQIHLRAWLSNTKFWFSAYPVHDLSLPQFCLPASVSLSNMYTNAHFQVLIFSLSQFLPISPKHTPTVHTHLPFLQSPQV